jgi:hypothetical protein
MNPGVVCLAGVGQRGGLVDAFPGSPAWGRLLEEIFVECQRKSSSASSPNLGVTESRTIKAAMSDRRGHLELNISWKGCSGAQGGIRGELL